MQNKNRNHLSTTKMITTVGLLSALSVVIGWVCKTYLTFGAIRITFENVPIILSGILYGPAVGAVVAVFSDIISCLISPNPSLNPIITLGAASIGIISGCVSRYLIKNNKFFKVSVSVFLSHIVGSMIIKSIGLHIFMRYEIPVLMFRIPLYLAIATCETAILYIIMKNKYITALLEKHIQPNNYS